MDEVKWYENTPLETIKSIIKDNINVASRSFVAIGYYLKSVRDRELYLEDGYQSIWEFAQSEFGISKSSASRFMAINDRFSQDGNSPILLEQYRDFSSSKLSEMLTMSDEQLEQVTLTTTIAEIREIKNPEKVVATSQRDLEIKLCKWDGKSNCVAVCATRVQCCAECEDHSHCNSECGWQDERIPKQEKSIDNLDFTVRTYNCLKRAGINTIDQLCGMTEDEVIAMRSMSRKCLDEIKERLGESGLKFKVNEIPEFVNDTPESVTETAEIVSNEPENVINQDESVRPECTGCKLNGNKDAGILECHPEKGEHKCICDPDSPGETKTDQVETVEADIIQTESEVLPKPAFTAKYHLQEAIKREEDQITQMRDSWTRSNPDALLKHETILLAFKLHLTDMEYPIPEQVKPVQPELPILKNNDQRKEFIDNYESWPVWIDQSLTGERYYRYNLTDNVAIVVKVSRKHAWERYKETKEFEYAAEQYYLLGIKATYSTSQKGTFTLDSNKTFYECNTNKSTIVEYLKEFQKKE